jgi:hypothetical protein
MTELLEYDLTSSSSLFDSQGLMSKSTKSDLMNEIAKKHSIDVLDDSKDMQVGYIADVMANVRKMTAKEITSTNFGEFSGGIVDYIQRSAKGADPIDYILIHTLTFQSKTRKESDEKPSLRLN